VDVSAGLPSVEELVRRGEGTTAAELNRTQWIATSLRRGWRVGNWRRILGGFRKTMRCEFLRKAGVAGAAGRKADRLAGRCVPKTKRRQCTRAACWRTIKRPIRRSRMWRGCRERLREWIGKRKARCAEGRVWVGGAAKRGADYGVRVAGRVWRRRRWGSGVRAGRLMRARDVRPICGRERESGSEKGAECGAENFASGAWIERLRRRLRRRLFERRLRGCGLSSAVLGYAAAVDQDREESGGFLAATSNNITILRRGNVRKGRFDEIFFVGCAE